MADHWITSLSVIVAFLTWIFISQRRTGKNGFLHPPGPKPLPLLGNVFHFPTSRWWLKFTELNQEFGTLVHLSVANKNVQLIGSQEIAAELLEGTVCADRPHFMMAGDLMGFGVSIAFIGYGERWRTYRRISHRVMSVNAVQMYNTMLEKEAMRLLNSLVQTPHMYREQIRFSLGRTIMDAIYGIDCPQPDNTYIKVAEETLDNISYAVIPGSFMVDIIPWLRYLPYIGLPFQKHVREAKKHVRLMVERPYKHVHHTRENGTAKPSFTSSLLDGEIGLAESDDWDDIVSWAAATMYGAAGETMHATLLNFVLAMTQHPDVQKKAQAELDTVVGTHRSPTFLDRQNLPYVSALVKELIRWRVVLPLGIPHVAREDITYKDYFIPKGSILIPNVWSISQDPVYYKDPQIFNPERFLKESPELDPFGYAFGYGPRVCLGRNFAMNQIYIFVASLLWAFNIKPSDPQDIPNPPHSSGFVSAPEPFSCDITPRHSGLADVLPA